LPNATDQAAGPLARRLVGELRRPRDNQPTSLSEVPSPLPAGEGTGEGETAIARADAQSSGVGSRRPPTWADAFNAAVEMLCAETGCTREQLLDDGVHIVRRPDDAPMHPAHRRFPPHPGWISIVSTGSGGVVAAQEWLLPELRPLFEGCNRDEMLMPIRLARLAEVASQHNVKLYGPWPRFLGASENIRHVPPPASYTVRVIDRDAADRIGDRLRFPNALYAEPSKTARATMLAAVAERDGEIVGLCGATSDSDTMWQLGIDVIAGHRGNAIAPAMASAAARAVMEHGRVPYYCTTSANIPSMRTALAAGFRPAWVEVLARPADRPPLI